MNKAIARMRGGDRDSGVALIMVMGIMLVGAIILTSLAMVTMYNAKRTVSTRIENRALASADAGVDLMSSLLEGKKYNQLSGVCTQTFTVNSDTVAVTTEYHVTRGATNLTVACPLTTDITTSLTVYSKATTPASLANKVPVTRTVVATYTPTPPEVTLDKAIFSEGSTTLTNNTKLLESTTNADDAHVYSNGAVTCATQEVVQGKLIAAHGDVNLTNSCKIYSDVWASGSVKLSASGSLISGNVYAASDAASYAVEVSNGTALITGSVLTNGGVLLNNARATGGGVNGTVFARTGGIRLQGQSTIGGSAYAYGDIFFENGAKVGKDAISQNGSLTRSNSGNTITGIARAKGTIDAAITVTSGNKLTGVATAFPTTTNPAQAVPFPPAVGYPTKIQAPPREQMPQMAMTATEIAKWQAAGWFLETYASSGDCTGTRPRDIINSSSALTWPRLIVFTGCTSPVNFDNYTMNLKGDLALVSTAGFNMNNENWFKSTSGTTWKSYFIVPSNSPGVTWTPIGSQTTPVCAPSRDISINKIGVTKVKTLFYTPCKFSMQNGLIGGSDNMSGQIYAGQVTLPNAITMNMTSIPVPSLSSAVPNLTDETKMNMAARFDLHK